MSIRRMVLASEPTLKYRVKQGWQNRQLIFANKHVDICINCINIPYNATKMHKNYRF